MFNPAWINIISFFYPLGNTLATCLTQNVPPEDDALILSLGCGDVRNILYTAYADHGIGMTKHEKLPTRFSDYRRFPALRLHLLRRRVCDYRYMAPSYGWGHLTDTHQSSERLGAHANHR